MPSSQDCCNNSCTDVCNVLRRVHEEVLSRFRSYWKKCWCAELRNKVIKGQVNNCNTQVWNKHT
jgi:hypothetical protein